MKISPLFSVIGSVALTSSFRCPRPYVTWPFTLFLIRARDGRLSASGLDSSSVLLFQINEGRLPEFLPVVVAKKFGFVFVIIMVPKPGKHLCLC